jgi:hypothetical protein
MYIFNAIQYYFTVFNLISYISFHFVDFTFSYFYINLEWYPEKSKVQVSLYWHLSYQYAEGCWGIEGVSREII